MPSLEKLGYWSLLSLPLSTAAIRRLEFTIGLARKFIQPYLIRYFALQNLALSFISHEMIARRNEKLTVTQSFFFGGGWGGGGKGAN